MEQTELSESPIDIKEYLYLFWSWAWLIILAGLLAGAAAYIVSVRTTPVYEASTRLLVSVPSTKSGFDSSTLVTIQTMISTYSQMLLDRPVLQGVIDQLELPITAEELKKSISVKVVTSTQILVVTVENTDPVLAADIANGIATVFMDRMSQLQSQRFAASRDDLAKQVSDMEGQITTISSQIAAIEQQMTPVTTLTLEVGALNATQTIEVGTPSTTPAPRVVITPDPAVLVQLQARLSQYLTIYSNLVTNYEQVRLAEAQTNTNIVVSEPANIPSTPVSPITLINTSLAGFMGILLATSLLFASNALDDTIKNPAEIQRKFNLPILGVIDSHVTPEDQPIVLAEPRSSTAEAFRSLRTNIIFASADSPLRRILVTSVMPQDGKTTVASNLAVVLAQGEKKTLLMDADLRRPSIQMQFGLPNRIGLTDLFVRSLDDFSSMTQSVNGLAVITSGILPPNPSELLTSKKMSQILEQLNQIFDLIVIDTPPVLTVTDAAALASMTDGVILVVKPGTTKLSALQQALEQLRAVRAHVLGIVLNEVNPTSRKYGYYFNRYYSKSSHYYKRDRKK